ncbi:hypothetical protein AXFE_17220 [Acidithrix ferrooxidans]|uniref:Uncharacterized protein n=1 Tax=Acidithrix ferrooxidans TaxID=1280514 RepID=A0A0D8HHE1_9ACTN|nr:hypothetical protein AXFE_17220 [Acidithrix ferrooxidans]
MTQRRSGTHGRLVRFKSDNASDAAVVDFDAVVVWFVGTSDVETTGFQFRVLALIHRFGFLALASS